MLTDWRIEDYEDEVSRFIEYHKEDGGYQTIVRFHLTENKLTVGIAAHQHDSEFVADIDMKELWVLYQDAATKLSL